MICVRIGDYSIQAGWLYPFLLVVFQLGIRLFMTFLMTFEHLNTAADDLGAVRKQENWRRFWHEYRAAFCGSHQTKDIKDYWHPTIIGALELMFYPVLVALGEWTPIGGWIAIKTYAQYSSWTTNRTNYNRFLIGNLLNLLAAAILAQMLTVSPISRHVPPQSPPGNATGHISK